MFEHAEKLASDPAELKPMIAALQIENAQIAAETPICQLRCGFMINWCTR